MQSTTAKESNREELSDAEEQGEEEIEENQMDDDYGDEDVSQIEEQKKVRQHLAQIFVPQKSPDQPIIFSYHYKYEKYLRDNNLIDPEKALQIEERRKRK